jgi:hypothetical protein
VHLGSASMARRWLLPAVLAILVIAVVVGAAIR